MDINTGCPLDTVSEETLPVLAALGSTATLVSEIIASKDTAVYKAIEESIEKANKEAISSAQKVCYIVEDGSVLNHHYAVYCDVNIYRLFH